MKQIVGNNTRNSFIKCVLSKYIDGLHVGWF